MTLSLILLALLVDREVQRQPDFHQVPRWLVVELHGWVRHLNDLVWNTDAAAVARVPEIDTTHTRAIPPYRIS